MDGSTQTANPDPSFRTVTSVADLSQSEIDEAVSLYRRAFESPPYSEDYSAEDALSALRYLFERGGLLVLAFWERVVVGLAGGYPKSRIGFYVEELAVDPEHQGRGLGRAVLRVLLDSDLASAASWLGIRTTVSNARAISLYESVGFVREPITEIVPHRRRNQTVSLDERVHLRLDRRSGEGGAERILHRVVVAYPSGNTTAIVFDNDNTTDRESLNRSVIEAIARDLPELPGVEQCCFVRLPRDHHAVARMEMFGGEFCGNATRSVIQLITHGRDYSGLIEASGVDNPLRFAVVDGEVTVEMPIPTGRLPVEPVDEGILVHLDGIAHLVTTARDDGTSQTVHDLLTQLLHVNKYDLRSWPAVGVSNFDPRGGQARFSVWVREVNTVFDETSCGSGTSAIGIACATETRETTQVQVRQPSGDSIVTTAEVTAGLVTASRISGTVKLLFDGELRL